MNSISLTLVNGNPSSPLEMDMDYSKLDLVHVHPFDITNGYDPDVDYKKYLISETNECPLCHVVIKSNIIHACAREKVVLSILNECPACWNTFLTQYKDFYVSKENPNMYVCPTIDAIGPKKCPSFPFEERIKKVSPQFVNIYNQSAEAELMGLDAIAGMGYRKSLEFLIKDFLISHPQPNIDVKTISQMNLSQCIKLCKDPNIQTVATRATWLGNDQTHYTKKFPEKNIHDLKTLIHLTVHWISMILLTHEASSIEPRK